MGKTSMHAKCKQCNKEMQSLVARRKQHQKCYEERTMFEEAGASVSELSLQDSASVTHHLHISAIYHLKEKKTPGTIDNFVIKTSILKKELIDEKIARFVYATNSSFRLLENPHFANMIQSLRLDTIHQDVAGKLLDKVYDEEIMQCATSQEGKVVNLSLDGWSNVHNDPVVCACITTEEGNVFLAETIDASGNAHPAAYLEVAAKVNVQKKFKC
ncbi:uncharacterized protein LOC113448146 isoform X2 [Pseudonaja textilis]|uniref:uncharacterized protein LOC113448146 isoform X2 n=1 Tax=Pseudonaja textilis TaxID=8673 RepID=UPI000EAA0711|nr:uncharacterized protein LOC113448146 isoform X2 [Pseudonaja textilis]